MIRSSFVYVLGVGELSTYIPVIITILDMSVVLYVI
jgi:hypothetical protein